jgi:hypothetical protein
MLLFSHVTPKSLIINNKKKKILANKKWLSVCVKRYRKGLAVVLPTAGICWKTQILYCPGNIK